MTADQAIDRMRAGDEVLGDGRRYAYHDGRMVVWDVVLETWQPARMRPGAAASMTWTEVE